jgi:hypothetical protein
MKTETSHLNKLRAKVEKLYSLMSNVLSTLCHLNHPKLLLQADIQKYKNKMTTVKAISAVVTIKTIPVIYLKLHATKKFECR